MARSGELVRLRRGAYARSLETDEAVRHRQLVVATLPLVAPDAVLSHRSAVVLHGLPTFGNLERVQLTCATGSGKRRGYVHLHVAPLPPDEVDDLAGVRVTSGARTVVDLARHQSFPAAVAIGDAALRRQVSREDLVRVLERASGRPGVAAARRVLAFLDERSESPGESIAGWCCTGWVWRPPRCSTTSGTRAAWSGEPTSAGRHSEPSASSTVGSNTDGCCARGSCRRTFSGPRSSARTHSVTWAGRSCAGPGPTCSASSSSPTVYAGPCVAGHGDPAPVACWCAGCSGRSSGEPPQERASAGS